MTKFAFRNDERLIGVTVKAGKTIHSVAFPAWHGDVYDKMQSEGHPLSGRYRYHEGFQTTHREHVSRQEATKIAKKQHQLWSENYEPPYDELHSDMLK